MPHARQRVVAWLGLLAIWLVAIWHDGAGPGARAQSIAPATSETAAPLAKAPPAVDPRPGKAADIERVRDTDRVRDMDKEAAKDAAPTKATAGAASKAADADAPSPVVPPPVVPPPPPAAIVAPPVAPKADRLVIATWGGAYAQAQDKAVFQPFAAKSGLRLEIERHKGVGRDGDRLKGAATPASVTPATDTRASDTRSSDTRANPPDVLDLTAATLAEACAAGLLEPVEASQVDGDSGDFLDGALAPCGVASLAWSAVFVVDRTQFKGTAPTSLADVFDVNRFPGRRTLPRSPRYILEAALLADSIMPPEVYALLETDEGVAHALENLRRIATDVVWWDTGADAVRAIKDRRAAIGLVFSGRAFQEFAASPDHQIIWDGQIYDMNYWAIPKTSERKDAAREFLRFATAAEQLAATARLFPYGPVRHSAVARVGRHRDLGIELADLMPTSPRNLIRALRFDVAWWARNERRLTERFEVWLKELARRPG